jgi:hypothetical protein
MHSQVICLTSHYESNLSQYVTVAFEENMTRVCNAKIDSQNNYLVKLTSRIAKKAGFILNITSRTEKAYLVLLMGIGNQHRLFPKCFFNEVIPYCYDCWPASWDSWQSLFLKNKVAIAFFSSKQAASHFSQENPHMSCIWIPEATNPSDYNCDIPLPQRSTDVLEMGRKYDRYHFGVCDFLAEKMKSHLYEESPGQIIFPSRQQLVEGLSESKISVCFPATITHPTKAQGIETVTHRYFESIASKCVLIGHCPDELIELFGYNPCIEANLEIPQEQIIDILDNIATYQKLVDQNYNRLIEVGTWESRISLISKSLTDKNYICKTPDVEE